jgi:hypothetical protein
MKLFVGENRSIIEMLIVTMAVVSLTGGSAGAAYLTPVVCYAFVLWREKRRGAI